MRGHQRGDAGRQPERLQAPLQLGTPQLVANDRGEHVAGKPPLGVPRDAGPQQLERDDRDRLAQRQAVEIR